MARRGASSGSGKTAPASDRRARAGLVVGIGASAGGLGAFTSFLNAMPANSGMSFVLVQHLAPEHKSALVDLLARATAMPVREAVNQTAVEANTVYVIPPNATLTINRRTLFVSRPAPPRERRRPIDTFFASLGEDQGENAVCIILSGTGSDGTLGLKTVKDHGGLALAQAEFDHAAMSGMPHNAVATGLVDEVLRVEAMPERILAYRRHLSKISGRKGPDGARRDLANHLKTIMRILAAKTGHDFSGYKESTLARRVQRRMQVLQIVEVSDYVERLMQDPAQAELLFRDLLIGVTRFFRDPAAFAALEKEAIPRLLAARRGTEAVRIWVPGCATGEEVYSIAILVREALERHAFAPKVQIFGTDVDDTAIAFARAGRYRKTTGVSAERLARWFVEDRDDHCLKKEIREMCIFSTHSVVKDPPFSRLDLISCRNLLIYMNGDLQDRVLRSFHYALKPDGLLFLGPSEGVTRLAKFFGALNKKNRIFERKGRLPLVEGTEFPLPGLARHVAPWATAETDVLTAADRVDRAARQALAHVSPAYVVINAEHEILRFSGGEVGNYVEPASGAASLNLIGLLKRPLRAATRQALRAAVPGRVTIKDLGAALTIDGERRDVSVIVAPLNEGNGKPRLYVVAFQSVPAPAKSASRGKSKPARRKGPEGETLRHELRTTRMQLQTTIDELETANEEMRSSSEEYQSVNEELQSSNEELETAKEEMQSVNEELQTVNAEMQSKNEMLTRANSDLKNLLDSTEIATIFLDARLCIKNFTPGMMALFSLRDTDRGRPLTDIVSQLDYSDLVGDVDEVLRTLAVVEKEVSLATNEMTFIMRIRPYRTIDNMADGVVITFVDISERKKADEYRALLMGELDHRVKNILAIVSAVVAQTLKTSSPSEQLVQALNGRIKAIARTHNLLTRNGDQDEVQLRGLIATELEPYARRGMGPTIEGPDIVITPRAGLTLAMTVHELTSNAVKFGALSTQEGRLAVEWNVSGGNLTLHWTETGGPPVARPKHSGFGTHMIDRSLVHEFDGQVVREFLPGGLRCRIELPLTAEVGHLRAKKS